MFGSKRQPSWFEEVLEEIEAGMEGKFRSVDLSVLWSQDLPGLSVGSVHSRRSYEAFGMIEPGGRDDAPMRALDELKRRLSRGNLTAQDISRLRRGFALLYHPDRCPEAGTLEGNECVMAMANQLLDAAR